MKLLFPQGEKAQIDMLERMYADKKPEMASCAWQENGLRGWVAECNGSHYQTPWSICPSCKRAVVHS